MKSEMMMKVGRFVNRTGLQLKKHSPEILMVAGIAGTVASTVMACKATTKIDEILDDVQYKKEKIEEVLHDDTIEYTEEDKTKDLTIIYTQTGVKLLKLYGPALALGVVSIASIVAGHRILKRRNLALAAAYAAVDAGFKNYRKNVVERFGEELDKELRFGIKKKEVEEVVVDENGKETIEKKEVTVIDENPISKYSPFARFYDSSNIGWTKDPEFNLLFLRKQQNYANEVLRTKGQLLLNEVYDMLGIPRSKYGMVYGWLYNEKNPTGDNYVDFGIYDPNKEGCRDFVNGYERAILLDFNVDGNIYELL